MEIKITFLSYIYIYTQIYLYEKICDVLMFTVVTYNKVGFFDAYIYIHTHTYIYM